MEPKDWISLAIQVPALAAFIVFTTWMLKAFLDYLRDLGKIHREEAELDRQQRLDAMQMGLRELTQLCGVIEKMSTSISAHNAEAATRHVQLIGAIERNRAGERVS